jgi:diguanylate cyclase (GGDEF)-like protein
MASVPRGPRLVLAGLACALAVYVAYLVLGDALPGWTGQLYYVIEVGALVLCAWRALTATSERTAWWCMTAALATYAAGDIAWSAAFEHRAADAIPYPSFVDALYLAYFPLTYLALLLLVRSRGARLSRLQWLDGVIVALGTAAVGVAVARPLLGDAATDGDALAVITNLAYPIGDVVLLGMTAGLLGALGRRTGLTWIALAAAMTVFAVVDTVYLLQVADGTYVEDTLLDAGWPLAMLLIAVAAWLPRTPARARRSSPLGAMVIPLLAGAAVLGLLVWDHYSPLPVGCVWLAAACAAGLLLRIVLLADGHRRMLLRSERDARTDALTGLPNRRALMEMLDWIDEGAWPAVLALYDLDGFKLYNDRYGHPAGDVLLQRLASRLGAAMSPRAKAFRIGGDEFCVVVDPDEAEAVLAAADAALSEHGVGFAITGSRGAVRLPDEAADGTRALALVDERMYAAKRNGRASAVAQTRDVLMRAVEERSPSLGGHVGDVAGLATQVARRLGLSEDEVARVHAAAELHDVGKLAVPDAILDKPGPLDDDEWAFMRRHTIIGERILLAAPALADVAPLVRASHERWDGGGYPDGLAGEQIPLGARIVSLCDAYDAMVTDRAYRQAMTCTDALAEIDRCAGTQFDPAVVAAFRTVLAEIGELPVAV